MRWLRIVQWIEVLNQDCLELIRPSCETFQGHNWAVVVGERFRDGVPR